jgi:hypothetical protein
VVILLCHLGPTFKVSRAMTTSKRAAVKETMVKDFSGSTTVPSPAQFLLFLWLHS